MSSLVSKYPECLQWIFFFISFTEWWTLFQHKIRGNCRFLPDKVKPTRYGRLLLPLMNCSTAKSQQTPCERQDHTFRCIRLLSKRSLSLSVFSKLAWVSLQLFGIFWYRIYYDYSIYIYTYTYFLNIYLYHSGMLERTNRCFGTDCKTWHPKLVQIGGPIWCRGWPCGLIRGTTPSHQASAKKDPRERTEKNERNEWNKFWCYLGNFGCRSNLFV